MGTIKGDVFRYETISIQKEGVEPPQYRTFRVPVAVESKLVIPEEGRWYGTTQARRYRQRGARRHG